MKKILPSITVKLIVCLFSIIYSFSFTGRSPWDIVLWSCGRNNSPTASPKSEVTRIDFVELGDVEPPHQMESTFIAVKQTC
jgi:hypothetical protein